MGQPVAVVEKQSAIPGVVRYVANRSLTGMGHERFASSDSAVGPRPAAELARRLFDTGRVDIVHIYGNIVTVELKRGVDSGGLQAIVENLYVYYRPGFVPPPLELPPEEAPAEPSGAEATPAASAEQLSEAAKKIPAHLLERSRQAKERARAKAAEG